MGVTCQYGVLQHVDSDVEFKLDESMTTRLSAIFILTLGACTAVSAESLGTNGPPSRFNIKHVIISLERTECYSPCPSYRVDIHGSGKILYEGHSNVKVEGKRTATVPTEEVFELLKHIYEIRFFDMRNQYSESNLLRLEKNGDVTTLTEMISDLSTKIITIRIGPYEKRVEDYWNSPEDLSDLSPMIDKLARTQRWIN